MPELLKGPGLQLSATEDSEILSQGLNIAELYYPFCSWPVLIHTKSPVNSTQNTWSGDLGPDAEGNHPVLKVHKVPPGPMCTYAWSFYHVCFHADDRWSITQGRNSGWIGFLAFSSSSHIRSLCSCPPLLLTKVPRTLWPGLRQRSGQTQPEAGGETDSAGVSGLASLQTVRCRKKWLLKLCFCKRAEKPWVYFICNGKGN